jgi:hypothetical protein
MSTLVNGGELKFVGSVQRRGKRYGVEIPKDQISSAEHLHKTPCIITIVPIFENKKKGEMK